MSMRLKICALAVALVSSLADRCPAAFVYNQNFDTGAAAFTVNDPYWVDNNTALNGIILKTDGGNITQDASGPGFYLFEGTGAYNGSPTIAAGKDEFFISPTFNVTPGTTYNVGFKLTNENTTSVASVQLEIGGQFFGPSSATGTFPTNGWQSFSFNWNSGANTSASIILHDLTQATAGNDFGVDEIFAQTTAVPEPSSLALVASALPLGLGYWLRRRKRAG